MLLPAELVIFPSLSLPVQWFLFLLLVMEALKVHYAKKITLRVYIQFCGLSNRKAERGHLGSNHMLCLGKIGLLLLENGKSDKCSHRVTYIPPKSFCCRLRYNYSFSGFFTEVNPRDNNIPFFSCAPCPYHWVLGSMQHLSFGAQGTRGVVKWGTTSRAWLWWSINVTHRQSLHTQLHTQAHEKLSKMKSTHSMERWNDWWVYRGKEMSQGAVYCRWSVVGAHFEALEEYRNIFSWKYQTCGFTVNRANAFLWQYFISEHRSGSCGSETSWKLLAVCVCLHVRNNLMRSQGVCEVELTQPLFQPRLAV